MRTVVIVCVHSTNRQRVGWLYNLCSFTEPWYITREPATPESYVITVITPADPGWCNEGVMLSVVWCGRRYGGSKLERARDLFETAIKGKACRAKSHGGWMPILGILLSYYFVDRMVARYTAG